MTKSVESTKNSKHQWFNTPSDGEFSDGGEGCIPKPQPKKVPQQKSPKINKTVPISTDEDDEDGGFSFKQKKEPKPKSEPKKISHDELKKKRTSLITEDLEDEDGPVRKPKEKNKEAKLKKKSIFDQIFHHHHHSPAEPKPIKTIVISTDEEEDEDGGPVVKDYNTIKQMMSSQLPVLKTSSTSDEPSSAKISDSTTQSTTPSLPSSADLPKDDQKPKPTNSDPVPKEETTTTTKPRRLLTNQIHLVRRKSYEEAQNNSAPIVSQRSNKSNHENPSPKIENDKIRAFINNLVSAISSSDTQQTHTDKQLKQRKKRAQIRWYLAYTIIRNSSLRELRKQYLKQQTTIRVLTVSDGNGNTQHSIEQNISLVSVNKCEIETPAAKIEVLQKENMNSSITYTQTTHT